MTRGGTSAPGHAAGVCHLRVLTFNIWDVPFLATARKPRMQALATALAASEYDLVGLQEAWSPDTRALLIEAGARAGLAYSHTFVAGGDLPGGASGGGLLVLSRYPIVNAMYLRFQVNGQPYRLHHYDYQAGKGLGFVMVNTPSGPVDVYITHFIAQYDDDDQYRAHRVAQALESANFINLTSRSPLALLVCDMNSGVSTLSYELIASLAGMSDAYFVANPGQLGLTCNVVGTPFGDKEAGQDCNTNSRLDYVMYRLAPKGTTPNPWRLVESSVMFTDAVVRHGKRMLPVSDHYAVSALFTTEPLAGAALLLAPTAPAKSPCPRGSRPREELLREVRDLMQRGLDVSRKQRTRDFAFSTFLLLLCGAVLWWFAEAIGMRSVANGACCAGLACSSTVLLFLWVMYMTNARVVIFGGLCLIGTTLVLVLRTLLAEGWPAVAGMATMVALPVGIAFSTFTLLTDTEEVNGMKVVLQTSVALLQGCVPAAQHAARIKAAQATAPPALGHGMRARRARRRANTADDVALLQRSR